MGVLSAARGEEESGMGSGWAGGLDKRVGVGHRGRSCRGVYLDRGAGVHAGKSGKNVNIFSLLY